MRRNGLERAGLGAEEPSVLLRNEQLRLFRMPDGVGNQERREWAVVTLVTAAPGRASAAAVDLILCYHEVGSSTVEGSHADGDQSGQNPA